MGYDLDYVEITREEYERLLKSAAKLSALECAGVDNWEGYGYAMEDFYNEEDED